MFFCEVKEAVIGLFSSGRRANFSFPFTLLLNSINGRRKKIVSVTLQQSVQKQNSAL